MATTFVGALMLVPYTFAPKGYAFCSGQILPISQNTALFSLLGTMYGGDGKSTFALPNLNGAVPVGMGQGPGLSDYFQGQTAGSDSITLLVTEIPGHSHTVNGQIALASTPAAQASGNSPGLAVGAINPYISGPLNAQLNPLSIGLAGNGQPHNNQMPTLVLQWIIALQGVFPPRQ
jgi:microcystin-dependent protein